MTAVHYLSAVDVLKSLSEGSLSSEELISNLLQRIESVNGKINAIVNYDQDDLLRRARAADSQTARGVKTGPLHGLPITVKDNLETAGIVTTGGIEGRRGYVPSFDAPVVSRLKDAGAIIIGKTNCPKYCAGWETENEIYGRTNNPYNLEKTVGSSSGGEAAIIAAGGSYVGIGSDTGGSIRWPGSFCGVAGLVPTFGRVPRTGTIPPYLGFIDSTQIGPMARSVRDLALILPIIMGPDSSDPKCVPMTYSDPEGMQLEDIRISYYAENGFVEPDDDVTKTVSSVVDVLSKEGLDVEDKYPDASKEFFDVSKGLNSFVVNIKKGTAPESADLDREVELYPSKILDVADDLLEQAKRSEPVPGKQMMLGVEFFYWGMKLDAYRTKIVRFMKDYDAIICPVAARPAFGHGAPSDGSFNALDYLSYTHPYSLVGLPSVTLRAGASSDGLPIGIQVLARHGQEGLALRLGMLIEDALGGWQPPSL
jgi:amidase